MRVWRLGSLAQFVNPTPAAVLDVRFRRAMAHALDRKEMVDTFMAGVSSVAHSYLGPDDADYREIEGTIPRYEYDPARARSLRAVDGQDWVSISSSTCEVPLTLT
jgi:ABC-type transport system substrate-binding protein